MKISLSIIGVILFTSFFFSSCDSKKSEQQNSTDSTAVGAKKMNVDSELRAANDQLYLALNAMFTGDIEPMNALWSHSGYITDMGPFGGCLTGWDAIGAEFKKEAAMKLGGKLICNDLHVYGGTDMGYTVCVEVGENMSTDGKPISVSHRATNIFHLENGKWKLVHHQTDISPQLEKAWKKEVK